MGQSRLTSDCQLGLAHTRYYKVNFATRLRAQGVCSVLQACVQPQKDLVMIVLSGLTIVAAEVSAVRESGQLVRGSCTMEWGVTSGVQLRKM